MSQFTPQELEEFEFRERAEKEFASKQTPDARDTEAAVSNVVYPAVGAAVGAAAGSLPTKIVNGMVQDPVTGKWMAVENYARQMAQGKYYGGQNYNQVWDKIREYNADPTQGPRLEKEAMANRSTGQKMLANTPKPLQGLVSKPMGVIGRGTVGLGAGLQGSDALNRYNAGDTSGAVISGLGALGTAAAMIPHPVTRIGGTAIGLGAEGLNTFLDYLKKKSQKPAQPQQAQAQPQQPQQMAEGGSAKKKMSKAERAAKAIRENNKKKVPHLAKGGDLPPAENAARTQIIGTLPTYEKAEEELKKRGAQGRALDFGAGLGEGAKILKADTYEPFPKGWKPTFIDPKQIPTEAYGKLTNLNVMNVVPPKIRDEIASHIGRVIEPGGQGIVTTRGADVMKAKGRPGPEPMSIITSRDTYQKGFTKQELEDYMKRMLGEKYDVNKVNLGPAGVHVQKKKPTIYTGGGIAIPINAPVGSRAQETTGQGAAQIMNPLNLNFKEGGQVKHYLTGGSVLGAPADFVPGNGPPSGMTWSETQGQWMPSNSVVGAMPGFAPGTDPINNFDTSGNPTQNSNPYGFTAPSGPSLTVMSPYYNTKTGESWSAPSSGWTAPSSDWIQGALEGKFMPMPGPNPSPPQMSKAMPSTYEAYLAQQGPQMTMELKPWQQGQYAGMDPKTAYETFIKSPEAQPTPIGGYSPAPGSGGLNSLVSANTTTTPPVAPKPVAPITPQQPFQQRRVAPPLSGNINPSFAKRALPYKPKAIPKPMPRRRMFAEGGSTTPAWQRSEGKSPSGGLNALGRASYKRETGGELKAPQPEGGSRKKSFCARMGGMKKKLTSSKTANDPDSRINKALRKWKC